MQTAVFWNMTMCRFVDNSNVSQDLTASEFIYAENGERNFLNHLCKKGKAIPLQAWTGPEGSRMLRLPDFKTIGA
jgi:hypothetical protein